MEHQEFSVPLGPKHGADVVSGFIYFVRAGDAGPIKVGYAGNVRRRLSTLQIGCPCPLILLHHEPGSLADEVEWHWRLRDFRVRGEWFRPNWMLHRHLKAHGVAMDAYVPLPFDQTEKRLDDEFRQQLRDRLERAPHRIAMAHRPAQLKRGPETGLAPCPGPDHQRTELRHGLC